MKTLKFFPILFFLVICLPISSTSQSSVSTDHDFEVKIVYPPLSMSKAQLSDAQSLVDLHQLYKPSWVKKYESVEISTIENGQPVVAIGDNDILTAQQKKRMLAADVGSEISINVHYLPENNLIQNDIKLFDFSFIVDPDIEATYPGGTQQLNQYLKEKVIDKIPTNTFEGYALAAIRFSIDEEGKIINEQIYESSKNEKVDALLLETIRTMPNWTPAEYINGSKVKQEFALTIGNHESCVINTLNFRQKLE